MTPIFLPHTAVDVVDELAMAALPEQIRHAGGKWRALRDNALANGAHVLVLLWPTMAWGLLAVEVPAGVQIDDAAQLAPNLMANPAALQQMHENAKQGKHLTWLTLERPTITRH